MQKLVPSEKFSKPISGEQYSAHRDYITTDEIRRFIKFYALTIATSVIIALFGAALYIVYATPLYTARTQIIIDPSLPQVLHEAAAKRFLSFDNSQVESQLAVLRSDKIAMAVIDKLDLEEKTEFTGVGVSLLGLPAKLFQPSASAPDDIGKKRIAILIFQSRVDVRRVGISYAIDVEFASQSPQLAAQIANAMTEAYIEEQIAAKAQAASQSNRWLEKRINEVRVDMNDAARNVKVFRSRRDYRIPNNYDEEQKNSATNIGGRDETNTPESIEELESKAQTFRRIYESYLLAYAESVQRQTYRGSNARVITPATPPLEKSHPRTKLILALGTLIGCLAGFGIAFIRHSLDHSIKNERQIREEVGVEHLANIPFLKLRYSRSSFLRSIIGRRRYQSRLNAIIHMPFSSFTNGIKRLKAAITLAGRTRPIRCIGIASAMPNEGKTTIAANLAELFAAAGTRTLLIDCDLRNSSLSRQLAPQSEVGILEAINGSVEVEKCIVQANGLHIMPAKGSETEVQSDDLLSSEKMRLMLQRLIETYEMVIVEMPPLALVVDGFAISPLVDGVVLVAEWGATSEPILSEVTRSLRNAGAEILGAVVNKFDPSTFSDRAHSRYRGYMS